MTCKWYYNQIIRCSLAHLGSHDCDWEKQAWTVMKPVIVLDYWKLVTFREQMDRRPKHHGPWVIMLEVCKVLQAKSEPRWINDIANCRYSLQAVCRFRYEPRGGINVVKCSECSFDKVFPTKRWMILSCALLFAAPTGKTGIKICLHFVAAVTENKLLGDWWD